MGSPAFLLSLFVSIEWLQGVVLPQSFSALAGGGWQREIEHADCGNVLNFCLFKSSNKKLSLLHSCLSACVCVCGLGRDHL